MKKIITLLFCTAVLSSAFAQKNNRDDWKNNNNNRNEDQYNNNHHDDWKRDNGHTVYQNTRYSVAQRDQVIQRISREYDFKMQQVSYDRYMSRREKKRAIKTLQAQKTEQIRRVYAEYNNRDAYGENRDHSYKHNGRNDDDDHYNR